MAIIEQGILGPFRGKCGGVIGYRRNGVDCVRSMPAHYRDRKSVAQLRNRGRFTMVMKAMSVVRGAVTLGFGRFATRMTEMNVATRVNYYRLVKDGDAGMVYSWGDLVLSRGAVESLDGVMWTVLGNRLVLNWSVLGVGARGMMEDEVTMVAVNAERMEMRMGRGVARRGAGVAEMGLPVGWSGEEVWCYVMVNRGGEWSESTCVGQVCGGGVVAMEEGVCLTEGAVGLFDGEVGEEFCFLSDQSAIKVLSELVQSGGEEVKDEALGAALRGVRRRE